MASGSTHARVSYLLQAPITVAGVVTAINYDDAQLGAGLVVGGLVGIIVTPDIDHHVVTQEELRFYQLGRIPGVLWQWLWAGYEIVVPHRGISHVPVVGTLTRALYLAVIARVLLWVMAGIAGDWCVMNACEVQPMTVGALWGIAVNFHRFWLGVLAGWIVQDMGHWIFDLPPLVLVGLVGLVAVVVMVVFGM